MFVKTVTYKGHTIQQDAFGKWHITSMPWGDGAGEWPHFSALAKAKTFVEKRASEQPLAALEQHRELESIATDLVKWFTDPPDCPLFNLVNRARAYVGKEQLK